MGQRSSLRTKSECTFTLVVETRRKKMLRRGLSRFPRGFGDLLRDASIDLCPPLSSTSGTGILSAYDVYKAQHFCMFRVGGCIAHASRESTGLLASTSFSHMVREGRHRTGNDCMARTCSI